MRFARAKGSKASNERIPEEATPWSDMKKQLLEKNKQGEEEVKKREADKRREENYKSFLNEVEEEKAKNTKWAEFPTEKVPKEMGEKNGNNSEVGVEKKKKTKGVKRKLDENETVVSKKSKKEEGANDDLKVKKKVKKQKSDDNKEETIIDNKEETIIESPKLEKKKRKILKVGNKKGKQKVKKPTEKKPVTEEDLKKIEKKKQKKMRQLEKKKINLDQNPTKPPPKTKGNKQPRRKPQENSWIINGKEVPIAYVDGFPIKKEDADRLHQLRRQMISKGLPRSEIKVSLKLERRKAEKCFAREKKKVCFNCRKSGHNLSECPDLGKELAESGGTGICFKCGSTEHTHFECKVVRGQEFKFAQCFICQEQGHIARQCPDNARGLYPKGGACNVCGDVTHLKRDCPKFQAQQRQLEERVQVETIGRGENPDDLGRDEGTVKWQESRRVNKIVKFF